jgi:hypothetical protein
MTTTYPFASDCPAITHLEVRYTSKGDKITINNKGHLYSRRRKAPRHLKFAHPAVNNWNQLLCGSIAIGALTDVKFPEVAAVLAGTKPVGVVSANSQEALADKLSECLSAGFQATLYEIPGSTFWLTVSPHGTLEEFFPNLEVLARDYETHGLPHSAQEIRDYQKSPFSAFHHGHFDREHHPTAVVGLILGYPVEDTISMLKYPEVDSPPVPVKALHVAKSMLRADSMVTKLLSQEQLYVVIHSDSLDTAYRVNEVELEGSDFLFLVNEESGPMLRLEQVDSGSEDRVAQILSSILSRSEVFNYTTGAYSKPSFVERVDGGYELHVESERSVER